MGHAKVTVVGASELGTACAHVVARGPAAQVVLVDPEPGVARAAATDVALAVPLAGDECDVAGASDYATSAGSRVCVLACGHPPAPGVEPGEAAGSNLSAVAAAGECVAQHSPDAVIVVAVEPHEEACHVAMDASGFPRARVLGVGGVPASAAIRVAIAAEAGTATRDVAATVLGARGSDCVPLMELASVAGAPVSALIAEQRLQAIESEAREADRAEASAGLPMSTAAAVGAIVDAVIGDQGAVLPCAALCRGEYGVNSAFIAVPCRLGGDGIEEIIELPLAEQRLAALQASGEAVRRRLASLPKRR